MLTNIIYLFKKRITHTFSSQITHMLDYTDTYVEETSHFHLAMTLLSKGSKSPGPNFSVDKMEDDCKSASFSINSRSHPTQGLDTAQRTALGSTYSHCRISECELENLPWGGGA